ncbi:unnamed protein product [Arabidopsis halleri]
MKMIKQKKAHLNEIQINGGDVAKKVDYAYSFFEKQVSIDAVFSKAEMIDIIGVTKEKVLGIQLESHTQWLELGKTDTGYHHRTGINKKVYKIGKIGQESHSSMTEFDRTKKELIPMGGFPHYGVVKEVYLMVKGCVVGPKKRVLSLKQSLVKHTSRVTLKDIKLNFCDTSS